MQASGDMPLYFFQFPSPFPTFLMPKTLDDSEDKRPERMDIDTEVASSNLVPSAEEPKRVHDTPLQSAITVRKKSVSFAPETKPPAPSPAASATEEWAVDGVIGELLIYQSGIVKMRLGDGIVMDVRPTSSARSSQLIVPLRLLQLLSLPSFNTWCISTIHGKVPRRKKRTIKGLSSLK